MYDFIVQAIGGVGLAMIVSSFQMKSRKNILLLQMLGGLSFALHFALLGALTGAILNTIGVIRAVLFRYYDNHNRPIWPPIVIAMALVIATIFTWEGWLSLLPMAAMLAITYGFWQHNEQSMRRSASIAAPLWLLYNTAHFSIPGVITEIINICSILISLWRFRKRETTEFATRNVKTVDD